MALGAPGAYKSFWRPSILDGYLLRMLAAPAGAVLGVTLVAFLLDQTLHLIDTLAANGARLSYLFGLVTNLVPYELGLALPASFFVSMFIVIARLDEESEIDAILSGGVSFERIVAPLVFAGLVLGAVSLLLVGYLQPYSRFGERALLNAATDAGWTARLDPQVFINAGSDFTISADEADATGRKLKGVFIRRKTQTGESVVTATDGVLSLRQDQKTTDLRLDGGMILADSEAQTAGAQTAKLLRFGDFSDHEVIAGAEALRPRGGNEEELTLPELLRESQAPDALIPKRVLQAELYARLARSLAIPLLPLLALPLALAAKRGRRGPGMIIGAIILVMFHHGITLAKGFAAQGLLNPLAAMAGLFGLLALIAFWLFLSSRRRPGETPITGFMLRIENLFDRRPKAAPTAMKAKGMISLSAYLTRIMAVRTGAAALALIGLLQLIDLLERTSGILARGGVLDIGRWMLLRMPFLLQEVAPFAVLGGAIFTFSQLSRSSELVIMRISGLSIYQIFQRTLPVALAVAVLDLTVADQITPRAQQSLMSWWNSNTPGAASSPAAPKWFRIDGNVVMARSSTLNGQTLRGVSIYERDSHKALIRRVQAASATWTPRGWRLRDATITDLGQARATTMTVAATDWRTTLRPADTARLFASIYEITSGTAYRSLFGQGPVDRSPNQFKTRLFRTIAEGLAPIIMLLLALPTALGHSRSNRTGPIVFGLGCGLLYLVTDGLLTAMGSTGILPPLAAAWGAPVAFAAFAISILLYSEG
jgi:lipopolysaccharide export system permease protein